jgi:serine protease inhibitor
MTWGIGVLIATIVAIVIASVVINVIGSSSSSRLNGKCLTFNDDQDRMDYKVAKSTNLFDTRLFHSVASASPDNLVLSSHSVAAVLSLALLGAKGQTAQELGGVLALPCSSDEENTTAVENVYFSAYKVAHASLQVLLGFFQAPKNQINYCGFFF